MTRQTDDRLALSVEEAGRQLGLGRSGAYGAVRRGELPSRRIGRKIIIPRTALEKWLADAPAAAWEANGGACEEENRERVT